jgi:hypothetical protein
VLASEGSAQPVVPLALARGHDRLVHQVVAEHGAAAGAALGHRGPEPALHLPALRLRQSVVPGGHVLLVVAAQAGEVEIQSLALR